MDRRYVIADVFTDTAYGGNPLAVFLDGLGLDTRQMQAIAREMNLSETTFVSPGSAPGRFGLRIFTPQTELPFAGHPTIGTAVVLAETGAAAGLDEIVLEEAVGPVRVNLRTGAATLFMDGAPRAEPCPVPAAEIAAALSLDASAVVRAPWFAGYGVSIAFIELADQAAVSASALRMERWSALGLLPRDPYVFAVTSRSAGAAELRARMYAPAHGIPEDPATGSAAAGLAGSIGHPAVDGAFRLGIAQGVEMGRPSRIETTTRVADGVVQSISVGGGAVLVGEGRLLRLP